MEKQNGIDVITSAVHINSYTFGYIKNGGFFVMYPHRWRLFRLVNGNENKN